MCADLVRPEVVDYCPACRSMRRDVALSLGSPALDCANAWHDEVVPTDDERGIDAQTPGGGAEERISAMLSDCDASSAPDELEATGSSFGEPWDFAPFSGLEPFPDWAPAFIAIRDASGRPIEGAFFLKEQVTVPTLQRIVACVNACVDFDTDVLKAIASDSKLRLEVVRAR